MQIRAIESEEVIELWTGRFVADGLSIDGAVSDVATGRQIYQAVDLGYLLDRTTVRDVKAIQGGREVQIDRVPKMNKSIDRGYSGVGNRSITRDEDGIYRYSRDGAQWSHQQFLAMLLWDNRPGGIQFELTGQDSMLDSISSSGRVEGLTLRSLLDSLISRQRGFVWKVAPVGFARAPVIGIEVATVFDEEVTVGDVTLSPNPNIIELELGNVHTTEQLQLELLDVNSFDEVRVRGSLVLSCFTIDKNTFEKGWTDTEESNYKDGAKNVEGYDEMDEEEQIEANDGYRAQDRFRQVYRQWRMPVNWDWDVENFNVNPATDTEGGLVVDVVDGEDVIEYEKGDYFNDGKVFEKNLPLKTGWDYTGSSPVDRLPPDTVSEYSIPMVWVGHGGKYRKVTRLSEVVVDDDNNRAASCSVTLLDKMMGFELSASPGHEFADGHFDGAEPAGTPSVFDWEDIIATVAVRTDQRVEVVVEADEPIAGGTDRTLVIDLPYAQLWYIAPETVVGINADGAKEVYGGDDNILRNDKELLESVAAAAIGWYGKRRQTLRVTVQFLTVGAKVGDLVRSVSAGPAVYDEVNTVVTQVVHDYINGTTTVVTNYKELDFAAIR